MSRKLRLLSDGTLNFFCPGCNMYHGINPNPERTPFWKFNGNFEKPTFEPSVLARYPYGPDQHQVICHSFVTDGKIHYLGDCTHHLAGKIIHMQDEDD